MATALYICRASGIACMKNIIEQYRKIVIQIATPYSTGTGFLLRDANVVVTNFHVIQDNREVVIEGALLPRQLAQVVFTDPKHDLAFLAVPLCPDAPLAVLGNERDAAVGDVIVAIGHPFGLKYSATQGIVSGRETLQADLPYIQHDAALNPGNSGGPLVNDEGEVVGVNTFIISEGESMGYSLPVRFLTESLNLWQQGGCKPGTRCGQCGTAVFEDTVEDGYCYNCGAPIELPTEAELYEPAGIARTIEAILGKCGHDVRLARRGPNVWEVRNGSASINISYYEPNGLIAGDAILCNLPETNIKPVYEFLLRQNFELEALSFSVRGKEIVLSLVIFDRYLTLDTGMKLFKNLFEKSDYYDNLLVEEFGAGWKEREA
ncbi:MAG: trypsin-like peptidase domain-containing protein [Saprospiraceae bacterium]|nr:trypsin-like peptidase domain-containing protein [Saprospiraceae bacterium]